MPHLVQLIDFAEDGGNKQKKTRKNCILRCWFRYCSIRPTAIAIALTLTAVIESSASRNSTVKYIESLNIDVVSQS